MKTQNQIKRTLSEESSLLYLKDLLDGKTFSNRVDVAKEVCREFNFYDPKGQEQVSGCVKALRILDSAGHIKLPGTNRNASGKKSPPRLNTPVPLLTEKQRRLYLSIEAEHFGHGGVTKVYDFPSDAKGKVTPYGVYDIANNKGWVSVGIDKDTSGFAVQSIRNWWYRMGQIHFKKPTKLLITADGGGSNGSRVRLWKKEIQKLADELNLEISICHFPPGTSKWNKIEHKLFSYISLNWHGKPLTSYEVVVNLIGSTTTAKGLKVEAELDENIYEKGIKVPDEDFKKINIIKNKFHGEWNYTIQPD